MTGKFGSTPTTRAIFRPQRARRTTGDEFAGGFAGCHSPNAAVTAASSWGPRA